MKILYIIAQVYSVWMGFVFLREKLDKIVNTNEKLKALDARLADFVHCAIIRIGGKHG